MNIKNKLNKIKNNKLNIATIIVAVISILIYIIGFLILKSKNYEFPNLLSMSADYITLCSCIIVLIQLIAYVKDSRHNEARSRKESALDLAKEYAKDILGDMTFIENVLSIHYNPKNAAELRNLIMEIPISRFTKNEIEKIDKLKRYSKIFENGNYEINYNTIIEQAIIHQKYDEFNLDVLEDPDKKSIANVRFRTTICNTLNTLEYFAMSVNQNVAESEMLFVSLHQTFIKFIYFMYPYICKSNIDEELYYTNIIELYRKWNDRKNKIEDFKLKNREKSNKKLEKQRKFSDPL